MTTRLKLESVVLAAGLGTRFGGNKLTHRWPNGSRLILDAIETAGAAPVRSVIVVWGADPLVAQIAEDQGAVPVHAEDYAAGLSASLKAGIAAVPEDADGAYVFLGDMPRIDESIFEPMAAAVDDGALAAAPIYRGKRGHPVLFSRALFGALMALEGDKGANALLDGLGEGLTTIPARDDGVLFDVDTRG